VPYAQIDDGIRLYYELSGAEDAPVILQFGGGLFGRHNFGLVNDGFREKFRLLSFDARGYGASSSPREQYTIEGWADDGAALLEAVGLDRAFVHGTSMGGMIAIAFTANYPEQTIAACADVAFAKCDVYRRTLFRVWRRMAESMPWDEFSDHVTTQAVGARFMESPEGERRMAEMNEHIELVEFPDIGHADLVECPADAVRIVSEFFERALVPA
jgi:pimeloyl-ACP methyl ester carboxylesterase